MDQVCDDHDPVIITRRNNEAVVMLLLKDYKDIKRNKYEGIGKPEALKHNLSGYWSRRINSEHRIVYKIQNNSVFIAQLRFHY